MGKYYMMMDVEKDGVKVQVPVLRSELTNSMHSKFMQNRIHERIRWIVDDALRRKRNEETMKNATFSERISTQIPTR